jgi:hypothetical protein
MAVPVIATGQAARAGTTSPETPNSSLYNYATSSPSLSSTSDAGCTGQYTSSINSNLDNAKTYLNDSYYYQDSGLVAQAAGLTTAIAGLATADPIAAAVGVIAEDAGVATSIGAVVNAQLAPGDINTAQGLVDHIASLPQCNTEFTGTISADAGLNSTQGISADNGAIWLGNTATGASSIATTVYATAEGYQAAATSNSATAIGAFSVASDSGATAVGVQSSATVGNATAVGYQSTASASGAAAVGAASGASGFNSAAFGYAAMADGQYSLALVAHAGAFADDATAAGDFAQAYGAGSTAVGYRSYASGTSSITRAMQLRRPAQAPSPWVWGQGPAAAKLSASVRSPLKAVWPSGISVLPAASSARP